MTVSLGSHSSSSKFVMCLIGCLIHCIITYVLHMCFVFVNLPALKFVMHLGRCILHKFGSLEICGVLLSILCCMQETVLSGFECHIVVNLCWPGSGRLSCIHNKVHSILLCGAAVLFPLRILDRVDKLGKILFSAFCTAPW